MCEHITGGANMYLYGCISLLVLVCAVCLFLCVISNQNTNKKPHYVSELSKCDVLLHKTQLGLSGTMVPRLDMCRSITSLSNVAQSPVQPNKQGNKEKGQLHKIGSMEASPNYAPNVQVMFQVFCSIFLLINKVERSPKH